MRQRQISNVELQIEVSVIDPVRVIQAERDLDQSASEEWQEVDTALHDSQDGLIERLLAVPFSQVVNGDRRYVAKL